MQFDAEEHLRVLETRIQEVGHPREDRQAARVALERALGQAQLALSNFSPDAYPMPNTLYSRLACHVELAKQTLAKGTPETR